MNASLRSAPYLCSRQDNPRLPKAMTEKKSVVKVCADGSCTAQANTVTGAVLLRPNMTDQALKTALEPVKGFPVLHLADVWHSWGGFEDAALQTAFTADISGADIPHGHGRPAFLIFFCPSAWLRGRMSRLLSAG